MRERREDVPLLVDHFVQRFAREQHKPVPRLGAGAMPRLIAYDWPGNVRELQSVVERAVILGTGTVLDAPLFMLSHALTPQAPADAEPAAANRVAPPSNVLPFAEAERHAIIRALEMSGWRVSGRAGAAEILSLKPTTLQAKMKKLDVRRPSARRDNDAGSVQTA